MVEAFQKAHPEIEIEHFCDPTADHVSGPENDSSPVRRYRTGRYSNVPGLLWLIYRIL